MIRSMFGEASRRGPRELGCFFWGVGDADVGEFDGLELGDGRDDARFSRIPGVVGGNRAGVELGGLERCGEFGGGAKDAAGAQGRRVG